MKLMKMKKRILICMSILIQIWYSFLKILKIFLLFYLYSWSIAYLFFQQSICRFPEELRSTHFIAIRITDPDIIRTAKSIQENIVSKEEALNDCCMGIGKKHALKIYDQFVLDISCTWGSYIVDSKISRNCKSQKYFFLR